MRAVVGEEGLGKGIWGVKKKVFGKRVRDAEVLLYLLLYLLQKGS